MLLTATNVWYLGHKQPPESNAGSHLGYRCHYWLLKAFNNNFVTKSCLRLHLCLPLWPVWLPSVDAPLPRGPQCWTALSDHVFPVTCKYKHGKWTTVSYTYRNRQFGASAQSHQQLYCWPSAFKITFWLPLNWQWTFPYIQSRICPLNLVSLNCKEVQILQQVKLSGTYFH